MRLTKAELRMRAKEARSRLTPAEIARYSASIERRLIEVLDGFTTVMVYVSKPPEVETRGLIAALNNRGVLVVVPIIERETRSLRLSALPDPGVLVQSTFNVPEPIGHEIPVRPEDIQAVVVPMLGFDSKGNRLGYGAGYYDRFLRRYPHPEKIGIAFSCQQVECIPADENDIMMDCIITEKVIIEVSDMGT
ncbi:MAG TPA: 5-formyltetrahydrofolate cyclo-ligase [Methanoculleus sp.]|jgi:5-formyltetrahydrofolate cyclo-ligase|nr:5-formyltetrahydrofolate cyclo-ligase [Methanoculleus sp.]MBP8675432.1 5-formyltetrahydrofolate cyclo-ligase [Methanoculleus sp.]HON40047.1 5-formyltetrahydrofolate cyclo-ligase [Methanoculleus sp.]HRD25009.1 5-formyltetrahydrofolate cyclo-ligase [Methanoculleus sp.]